MLPLYTPRHPSIMTEEEFYALGPGPLLSLHGLWTRQFQQAVPHAKSRTEPRPASCDLSSAGRQTPRSA